MNVRGVSLIAAATQFPLQNPAITAVVIGASDVSELASNIDHFNTELPEGLWDEMREAGLLEVARTSL